MQAFVRRIERGIREVVRYGRTFFAFIVGYLGHEVGPAALAILGILVALLGILMLRQK